ncbi:hypothetical protein CLE01_06730 [Cryobacterium levicorallinum]|nr:hypothetical protein CLE01_06730 [Cryobacterium levicorallinum]
MQLRNRGRVPDDPDDGRAADQLDRFRLVSKFGRYKWMRIAVPGRCYREPMRTLSPRPNRPAAE